MKKDKRKRSEAAKAIEKSFVKARLGGLVADEEDEAPKRVPRGAAQPSQKELSKRHAKPGDPDPPPFDAMGRHTVRDRVDDLLYSSPRAPKECAEHDWGPCPYYDLLKQCSKCRRTKMRKKARLNKLLPIFKDKIFPPVDVMGRYHDVCIVNRKLLLKRSWFTRGGAHGFVFQDFVLYVKFPKGWLWTSQFSEFAFDRLIRQVDPLLDEDVEYDPKAVFTAAQTAIYGKSWGTGGLKLERIT